MMAATMLSVATPVYSDPSRYQIVEVPRPSVTEPTDVVIKVHAASVNPIDVKLASGIFKLALRDEYATLLAFILRSPCIHSL
jgi:NADPH:quinone reductase-like Zn-dependent oxidoreductase